MQLTTKQIRARSYYLAELVADYFAAYRLAPTFGEIRVFFTYATRKAHRY